MVGITRASFLLIAAGLSVAASKPNGTWTLERSRGGSPVARLSFAGGPVKAVELACLGNQVALGLQPSAATNLRAFPIVFMGDQGAPVAYNLPRMGASAMFATRQVETRLLDGLAGGWARIRIAAAGTPLDVPANGGNTIRTALAACYHPTASAAPSGSHPAATTDEAAVRAVIAHGYSYYRGTSREDFVDLLSPEFKLIWDRAVGEGAMGVDPFCTCQDFDAEKFRYRIVSLTVNGARALANVDVDDGLPTESGGPPWTRYRLTFARTPQGWRLDDLGDATDPSLKAAMMKSKPGSWGE